MQLFAKVGDDDATITVTENGHEAVKGDFVTFSSATSLGGNITATVLNQEYQIDTIVNANSYTIEAKDTSGNAVLANSSDTGNGGSNADAVYQATIGLDTSVVGNGWNAGSWGRGSWNSAANLTVAGETLRVWSHDNFGEDLIINVRGAGIYRWVENSGTSVRAADLSGVSGANQVPTVGLQVITSETDRHLIVLGADPLSGSSRTGVIDPMLVAFFYLRK